jgi:hypothetical protein
MQYTLRKKGWWHMMKNCRVQRGRKSAAILENKHDKNQPCYPNKNTNTEKKLTFRTKATSK